MKKIISKSFYFEAAHNLTTTNNEVNKNIHGHSFKIKITVGGTVNEKTGFVMDFSEIDSAFSPIFKMIDHAYLNELDGLTNPSSENLCKWIWSKLIDSLPNLKRIEIKETESTGCIYEGEIHG